MFKVLLIVRSIKLAVCRGEGLGDACFEVQNAHI